MSRLFLAIAILFTLQANAAIAIRPLDTIPAYSSAHYLKKSKRQLTTAIVMAGVGVGAFVYGGCIIVFEPLTTAYVSSLIGESETQSAPAEYYVAMIGGAILALASISVFASSRQNRRLSKSVASVGLKMEKANLIQKTGIAGSYFPAVKLSLRF